MRYIGAARLQADHTDALAALLLDVKGPEIRTGLVEAGAAIELRAGSEVDVTVGGEPCTPARISLTYKDLPGQITPGKHILIADGTIDLEVLSVKGRVTRCAVRTGGSLGSLYIQKGRLKLGLVIGLGAFLLAAAGLERLGRGADITEMLTGLAENTSTWAAWQNGVRGVSFGVSLPALLSGLLAQSQSGCRDGSSVTIGIKVAVGTGVGCQAESSNPAANHFSLGFFVV